MIPPRWDNIPDWQRIVALQVNEILRGYPYLKLNADPGSPEAGFTYFNTTTGKVRTWDGAAWFAHY